MDSNISSTSRWRKTPVDKGDVERLKTLYGVDPLSATILLRRGVRTGKEILYFAESSLRFQHNPFLFNAMEDAVDRILDANEEAQKVLIFGDKDTDGITATTLLYEALVELGLDTSFKVPQGDETYGLSKDVVESFASQGGNLIITVDCGISNAQEIALACQLGLDVIVFDHHDPSEGVSNKVQQMAITLDAKLEDSGYPFDEISGCALAYKVAQALRFSKSEWYKVDMVLLDARVAEDTSAVQVECIRTRNLVEKQRLCESFPLDGTASQKAADRLISFLTGRMILCWDEKRTQGALEAVFSSSIDFALTGMRDKIAELYPWAKNASLERVRSLSKILRYTGDSSQIDAFYNLFVTFAQQSLKAEHPAFASAEQNEVQLVALAALADVMPMKNENRLFVKNALALMSDIKTTRRGLSELLSRLGLLGKPISSSDLSWKVIPTLNATGRLGQADLGVRLFIEADAKERERLAGKIAELNEKRKEMTREAEYLTAAQAKQSVEELKGKLCFVYDERVNKGVSGILAGHLVSKLVVPTIVTTKVAHLVIGSMRSCRGLDATKFLAQFQDLFESYGGHFQAAGFNLSEAKFPQFRSRLEQLAEQIMLESEQKDITVDAEIPARFMTADLEKVVDFFEPHGHENPKLLFVSRGLPIMEGGIVGKTERQHLKITVDCGSTKWPCIFWGEGERWGRDFTTGDKVDILFNVEKNYYNGMKSLNLLLQGIRKASDQP